MINQFSLSNTVNSLTFSRFQTPFNQFNLNSNSNSSTSSSSSSSFSESNLSNFSQLIKDKSNFSIRTNQNQITDQINVRKFLNQRSYGNRTPSLSTDYGLNHLISNNLLKEDQFDLGQIDKIYSSCWLNTSFVLIGTKCNQLILINLNNGKHYSLPVIESRNDSNKSGGLYSIVTNSSRTLLATGTKNGNDLTIYKLPSLDVLFLLENGHTDFIFDICWLDDEFLISGSRDSNIILWKIDETKCEMDENTNLYKMNYLQPTEKFNYFDVNRIRCLSFNKNNNEIAVLSFNNAKFHLIDALTMKKKQTSTLSQTDDLVCLTQNNDNLYAIGSKSHVLFMDSRTLKPVSTIASKDPNCGIRSLSFNQQILTLGTGIGQILFYDIRNSRYFNNCMNQDVVVLKTSKGWLQRTPDNRDYGHFTQIDSPAIYTHQYDQSHTRLLTAGGPLASQFVGNYCGLWS